MFLLRTLAHVALLGFGSWGGALGADLFADKQVPLPFNPGRLANGDFDGDGRADVVLANGVSGGSLALLRSLPAGGFAPLVIQTLPTSFPVAAVLIGRFDGDAHLDVVAIVMNVSGLDFHLLSGDGAGNLGAPTLLSSLGFALASPKVPQPADLDGDGVMEFVLLTTTSTMQVLKVLPSGLQIVKTLQMAPSIVVTDFELADVTHDGIPDVVAATASSLTSPKHLRVFDGSNGFGEHVLDTSPVGLQRLLAADVDGDGRQDVLARGLENAVTSLYLLRGINGPGGLAAPKRIAVGHITPVRAADCDGDGDLDLLTSHLTSGYEVRTNDGTGAFSAPSDAPIAGDFENVGFADGDGDGLADTWARGEFHLTVLRSHGGAFGPPLLAEAVPIATDVALTDTNGDGTLDLVRVAGSSATHVRWRLGQGGGAFGPSSGFELPGFDHGTRLTFGDLHADGTSDLLVPDYGFSDLAFAAGTTSGPFAPPSLLPSSTSSLMGSHLGDFDRDGDLDLVLPAFDEEAALARNDGAGALESLPAEPLGEGIFTHDSRCVDVDLDGKLDLVIVTGTHERVHVVPGSGNIGPGGSFGSSVTFKTVNSPQTSSVLRVETGDVDADGLLDIVTLETTSSGLSLVCYRGTGNLQFAAGIVTAIPHLGYPQGAPRLADLDGDGDLDVVFPAENTDGIAVARGDGTGKFDSHERYGGAKSPGAVACADIDQDGDLDLAVADDSGVRIFFNQSNVSLAPTLRSVHPQSVPVVGGVLTLEGERLSTATSLTVGGATLGPSEFTIESDERIRFTPPVPTAFGSASVTVVTAAGASNAKSFQYVATDPPRHVAPFQADAAGNLRMRWGGRPGRIPFLVANADGATFDFGGKKLLQPLVFLPLPPLDVVGAGSLTVPAAAIPSLVPFHTQFWTIAVPGTDPNTLETSAPRVTTVVP